MFSETWFAVGLITDESAEAFARYAAREPGKTPRHWRWLAFQDYLEENTPLDAERCRDLFQLGEAEPDLNLATAMKCAVLYQRYCPAEVKRHAADSDRAVIRRALRFVPRGST